MDPLITWTPRIQSSLLGGDPTRFPHGRHDNQDQVLAYATLQVGERRRYVAYSMAKDATFEYTDIKQAPWYVVPSDDKRTARLNCISHILSQFEYDNVMPDPVGLPEREHVAYVRPPIQEQTFVPALY